MNKFNKQMKFFMDFPQPVYFQPDRIEKNSRGNKRFFRLQEPTFEIHLQSRLTLYILDQFMLISGRILQCYNCK